MTRSCWGSSACCSTSTSRRCGSVGASFAAVELDEPFVRVMLRPDGTLNLVDLSHLANPGPPSESDETPRVFIDRLSVSTGRVAFEDRARATPFATELRPITFELRDFSTGGESGNAYSLHGASLDGERFAWSGTFRLTPLTSSGKFEVSALKARTIWSYLREALAFEFTKGASISMANTSTTPRKTADCGSTFTRSVSPTSACARRRRTTTMSRSPRWPSRKPRSICARAASISLACGSTAARCARPRCRGPHQSHRICGARGARGRIRRAGRGACSGRTGLGGGRA